MSSFSVLGSKIEKNAIRKPSKKKHRVWIPFFAVLGAPGPNMRSEIDVFGLKNGPKTEPETKKTKFGRHAEFIGPANQNQGSDLPETDRNRRTSRQKGDRKTTFHSVSFFCRFFEFLADFLLILGSLGGALGEQFWCFLVSKFQADFWAHFWRRAVTTAVPAVRHFMACTGVAGGGLARPRPQGGGRIEDAGARPPHPKMVFPAGGVASEGCLDLCLFSVRNLGNM